MIRLLPTVFMLMAPPAFAAANTDTGHQVFDVKNIPCYDVSTGEEQKQYSLALGRAMGASYELDSIEKEETKTEEYKEKMVQLYEETAGAAKKLADLGNQFGMLGYAGFTHTKLAVQSIPYSRDACSEDLPLDMQESSKSEVIAALSYVYIANETQTWLTHNIEDFIDAIERKSVRAPNKLSQLSCIRVSIEWIAEAKENAVRWRAHCQSIAK